MTLMKGSIFFNFNNIKAVNGILHVSTVLDMLRGIG